MANCETCKGKISIHAPRGGSDGNGVTFKNEANKFQSTLPVGGATTGQADLCISPKFQSTLPVGGATLIIFSTFSNP